jgi:hypothetical protein
LRDGKQRTKGRQSGIARKRGYGARLWDRRVKGGCSKRTPGLTASNPAHRLCRRDTFDDDAACSSAQLLTSRPSPRIASAQARSTIRFKPNADLTILDPVWTTAFSSRYLGLLSYDTLYGVDDAQRPIRKWPPDTSSRTTATCGA